MQRILLVFGTRPEVIKLAPVIHALRARPREATTILCSTGQHREMLDQTLAAFELTPDVDLRLMQPAQRPADLLGRLLLALGPVIDEARPDTIVVQGDTTTVMAAALAGFLSGAKVAHVEAGLRTRDKRAPFPEEVNRRVTGVVADWHFAPTVRAAQALIWEGAAPRSVFVTGNSVVDALFWMRERCAGRPLPPELDPGDARLVLVTAHRRESFGQPLAELCGALRELADRFVDVQIVYPVHLNPAVQEPVKRLLADHPRIRLIEPLDYAAFVALLTRAHLVLTDSGGVQEEAPALGKPVLVLRDKTERPEGVAAGVVRLVGMNRVRIVEEATRLLCDEREYALASRPLLVYGDGRSAARIVEVLLDGAMATPPFATECQSDQP